MRKEGAAWAQQGEWTLWQCWSGKPGYIRTEILVTTQGFQYPDDPTQVAQAVGDPQVSVTPLPPDKSLPAAIEALAAVLGADWTTAGGTGMVGYGAGGCEWLP